MGLAVDAARASFQNGSSTRVSFFLVFPAVTWHLEERLAHTRQPVPQLMSEWMTVRLPLLQASSPSVLPDKGILWF